MSVCGCKEAGVKLGVCVHVSVCVSCGCVCMCVFPCRRFVLYMLLTIIDNALEILPNRVKKTAQSCLKVPLEFQ